MRKRFSGKVYTSYEHTQNAARAEHINELLDAGRRVFGDDGPQEAGVEHEIEEALSPKASGIEVLTKAGLHVTIYSMDYSKERQT